MSSPKNGIISGRIIYYGKLKPRIIKMIKSHCQWHFSIDSIPIPRRLHKRGAFQRKLSRARYTLASNRFFRTWHTHTASNHIARAALIARCSPQLYSPNAGCGAVVEKKKRAGTHVLNRLVEPPRRATAPRTRVLLTQRSRESRVYTAALCTVIIRWHAGKFAICIR